MRWLALGGVAAAWWARRTLVLVTVAGDSMLPALRPGDRVLVRRTRRLRAGQVVVLSRRGFAGSQWLVKRVAAVDPPGHVVVLGDNPAASMDSRAFGPVPLTAVLGVEVGRFRSPAGARPS